MKAQKNWRSSLVIAALLPVVAVAACTGKIGSGGGVSSGGGGGTGSGSGGAVGGTTTPGSAAGGGSTQGAAGNANSPGGAATSAAGSAQPPISTSTMVAESAGQLMMRRLTATEYDNALNDLFGDTTAPAVGWSADALNLNGFTSPVSTPDLYVQNFDSTADTVVETALAAGKITIPCTSPTAAQESACAANFITTFGLQAYRRPVAAAEQTDLMTLFTTVRGLGLSFNESIGAVVKGIIQSPNFLYHWEIGPTKPVVGADGLVPLTQWQVASRLAESLWDSIPDSTILTAAQGGQLGTAAEVAAQAQRMLADPKALRALDDFHQQWLLYVGFNAPNLTGIPTYGALTAAAVSGLTAEFDDFILSVYQGDGTLKSLLTAPYAYVNHDLAAVYGVTGPAAGAPSAKVALDPTQRGGLFTQVSFLSSFGSGATDNPILRGLSIYTKLMCGAMGPPAAQIPPVAFSPSGTTRQAYATHGAMGCAQGCHNLFDPPGFAFEAYSGIGQYRTTENGQAVDSTGVFTTPQNATLTFNNALDLMGQLASSSEAQLCIDRQWARYMFGRMETTADVGSLQLAYQQGSSTPGYSIRDMLTTFVSSKAYLYRTLTPGETL
jgi:hypothetical protein